MGRVSNFLSTPLTVLFLNKLVNFTTILQIKESIFVLKYQSMNKPFLLSLALYQTKYQTNFSYKLLGQHTNVEHHMVRVQLLTFT